MIVGSLTDCTNFLDITGNRSITRSLPCESRVYTTMATLPQKVNLRHKKVKPHTPKNTAYYIYDLVAKVLLGVCMLRKPSHCVI